jgi:hypothetical protein
MLGVCNRKNDASVDSCVSVGYVNVFWIVSVE